MPARPRVARYNLLVLSYLPELVTRFLGLGDRRPLEVASAGSIPVVQGYPTQRSMSAMAAFPWVRACVLAVVDDLSGLPLYAVEEDSAGGRARQSSNPVLDALRRPGSITGRRLRRQLLVDFLLTGNAYIYVPSPAGMALGLSPLIRLHPSLVEVECNAYGLVTGYKYNGIDRYSTEEVLHVADVSWADNVEQVLGESAIRTLHDDLTSMKAAKEMSARAAKRGRPDFLVSSKDPNVGLGKDGARKVAEAIEGALSRGHGALVVDEALDVTPLGLTPHDIEFQQQNEATIYAILAVFGVVPVRVGLPGANYGTAKTQMRSYWERLQHLAALFDDEISRLTGNPRVRIEHDFTSVDALQVAQTERLERVAAWVAIGADPREAAEYEGFINPPVAAGAATNGDLADRRRPAREPEEPQGTRRSMGDDLRDYLAAAARRYTAAIREHAGDPTRFDLRHSEAERLRVVLGRHLSLEVAERYADHVAAQTAAVVLDAVTRAAVDGLHQIDVAHLAAFGPTRARALCESMERAA